MAEEAQALLAPLIEEASRDLVVKPVGEMNAAELLGATSLEGLRRLYELVSLPLEPPCDDNLKRQRLVGDMALGVNKLFMRAAEGEFRARRDDALTRLLEQIAEERAARDRESS